MSISQPVFPCNNSIYKGTIRVLYIKDHPIEGKDLVAEYNALCGLDAEGNKKTFAAVASYGELRMWFLSYYPEFTESRCQIDRILEEVKSSKTAA